MCVVGVQSQGQWDEEWIVVEDDTKFNFTYEPPDKISGVLTIPEFPVTEPDASVARLLETDLTYKIACFEDGCDWESFGFVQPWERCLITISSPHPGVKMGT